MKVFIVAPNIGLHMGNGGGARVCMAMAKVFEELGYEPYLVAVRGYTVERLSQIHGIKVDKTKTLYLYGYGNLLSIPFPLQVKLIAKFLEKIIPKYNPQIIVFHDDVPKLNTRFFRDRVVLLYSHFPYAARIAFNVTDAYEVSPPQTQLYRDRVYRRLLENLIYIEDLPENVIPIANSTITAVFMKMLWKVNPAIVYPPLTIPDKIKKYYYNLEGFEKILNVKVPMLITLIAGLQPNKRIEDAIRVIPRIRYKNVKLFIVGYSGPSWYREYLHIIIQNLNAFPKIRIFTSVSEELKWRILLKTGIILSMAHFEPFGIAVAEGMATGAVPIVYRGSLSGPWIDIVERGKYGFGFRYENELVETINNILNDESMWRRWAERLFHRSTGSRHEVFKEKLFNVLTMNV